MRFSLPALIVGPLLLALQSAESQGLRGVVLDSASRQPVPGAVVSLLDSTSAVIGRVVTSERGRFAVPSAGAVRRIRVQRIGFHPREQGVQLNEGATTDVQVIVAAVPSLLAPVRVISNSRCSRRDDRIAAYALLEQARSALLANVVSRATNTAAMRVLAYERTPDDDDRRVMRVRIDSGRTALSFAAARAPADFVEKGFVRTIAGDSTVFFAPDAEVLLSDNFSAGYCFRLRSDGSRHGQVGLGFEPDRRRRGINAITGTLWIDTAQRALVDLDFRYSDLGREADAVRPGGMVSFREVRPGVVFIDRWSLQLPRARADTFRDRYNRDVIRTWYEPVETGAELAFAHWADGIEWHGHLGTLRASMQHGDSAARGVRFRLYDTDYQGTTDSLGRLEIRELLPGPYILVEVNEQLAAVNYSFIPSLRFQATRDSVVLATLQAPTFQSFAADICSGTSGVARKVIVAQVVAADGSPVAGAEIRAKKFADLRYFYGDPEPGQSGNMGNFHICLPAGLREPISISVRSPEGSAVVSLTPTEFVTPLRVVLRPPYR